MPRLFFALCPDKGVRASLTKWSIQAAQLAGGRKTQPRNLHMTLVFLGESDPALLPELKRAAASVAVQPFTLALDAIQYWPHNRIVWAGGEAPEAMQAMVCQLREALTLAGVRFDEKPFVPHVSLLRDARPLALVPEPRRIQWQVAAFVLMASAHDAKGVFYRIAAGPFGDIADNNE